MKNLNCINLSFIFRFDDLGRQANVLRQQIFDASFGIADGIVSVQWHVCNHATKLNPCVYAEVHLTSWKNFRGMLNQADSHCHNFDLISQDSTEVQFKSYHVLVFSEVKATLRQIQCDFKLSAGKLFPIAYIKSQFRAIYAKPCPFLFVGL